MRRLARGGLCGLRAGARGIAAAAAAAPAAGAQAAAISAPASAPPQLRMSVGVAPSTAMLSSAARRERSGDGCGDSGDLFLVDGSSNGGNSGISSAGTSTAAASSGQASFGLGRMEAWPSGSSRAPLAEAHVPPASWYTSGQAHAAELRAVFAASWQLACRASALRNPGTYAAGTAADGTRFVVTRTEDGVLHAFHNACRHRGAPVAPEGTCGVAERLVCPYHGWEYDLDGRLARATRLSGIRGFSASDYGLVRVPSAVYGGFVFVHTGGALMGSSSQAVEGKEGQSADAQACGRGATAPELPPPTEWFGSAASALISSERAATVPSYWTVLRREEAADAAQDVIGGEDQTDGQGRGTSERAVRRVCRSLGGDLVHVGARREQLNCNWKVFVENYLDSGYHLRHAHPSLADALDLGTYVCAISACGRSSVQRVRAVAAVDPRVSLHMGTVAGGAREDRSDGAGSDTGDAEGVVETRGATPKDNEVTYAFFYPNLLVRWHLSGVMEVNLVSPLTPESCCVLIDWYAEPSLASDADAVSGLIEASHRVQEENAALCAGVQRGLRSPAWPLGRYAPAVEAPAHAFHLALHAQLRAAGAVDA